MGTSSRSASVTTSRRFSNEKVNFSMTVAMASATAILENSAGCRRSGPSTSQDLEPLTVVPTKIVRASIAIVIKKIHQTNTL